MNKKLITSGVLRVLALCAIFSGLSVPLANANPLGGQIPQIPAFLPMSTDIPMTKKLPIDGEWMISTIKKRIRIEGGRAYALDPWVHLFVLKIQPLMVVQKNWRRTGPGQYSGEDLPLMGQFTATLEANGYLSVRIAGALGPANYSLVPIRVDNQRRFNREKSGRSSRPSPSPEEDYSDEEYEDEGYEDEEYGDEYEEEENYEDEEYGDEYEEEEGYEDEDYGDEEYEDEAYDEEYEEEEAPRKVSAIKRGKAKKGCKGKQIYLSGGSCYSCPNGYRRFSPTRKMTHPKACTERGLGRDTVRAKYKWEANGCRKGQFKHKGYCKSCPKGTKRMHVAGLDSGYCKVLD